MEIRDNPSFFIGTSKHEHMIEELDFTRKEGSKDSRDVTIYALSTCGHCKRCLKFMDEQDVQFKYVYFDLLDKDVKDAVRKNLKEKFPDERLMFPFIVIDDSDVIVGFHESKVRKALGL